MTLAEAGDAAYYERLPFIRRLCSQRRDATVVFLNGQRMTLGRRTPARFDGLAIHLALGILGQRRSECYPFGPLKAGNFAGHVVAAASRLAAGRIDSSAHHPDNTPVQRSYGGQGCYSLCPR